MMTDEESLRIHVWQVYHDIETLEDMGFAPVGFPPMNPCDHPDDLRGLTAVDEYNNTITLMKFGPRESVIVARPCEQYLEVKIKERTYKMERARICCQDNPDRCIEIWMDETLGGGD